MSSKRSVDAAVVPLAADELEVLADLSLERADRYAQAAPFMDDEAGRQLALALSDWRRCRGLYFRELSAEAERMEADHLEWADVCVSRSGVRTERRLSGTAWVNVR